MNKRRLELLLCPVLATALLGAQGANAQASDSMWDNLTPWFFAVEVESDQASDDSDGLVDRGDQVDLDALADMDMEVAGQGTADAMTDDQDGGGAAGSNPLSSVNKIDLTWNYTDSDSGETNDFAVEGSFMISPKVKLLYEVHYLETNITGTSENDWSSVNIKPVYFIKDAKINEDWAMRMAAGVELIIDFDNSAKGIGTGSDQIAPLFGFAFSRPASGTVLIPLIQHFTSLRATGVNS